MYGIYTTLGTVSDRKRTSGRWEEGHGACKGDGL